MCVLRSSLPSRPIGSVPVRPVRSVRSSCRRLPARIRAQNEEADPGRADKSKKGQSFQGKNRRRGRPEHLRSPDDSPMRDGNRDRLIGLLTERAAKTLLVYLQETNRNVFHWLMNYMMENPIPKNGSWDDVSGDTFLRQLLAMPGGTTKPSGKDALFDNTVSSGVDPRSLAQRIMEIRKQLSDEFVQDLKNIAEENSTLLRESLECSLEAMFNGTCPDAEEPCPLTADSTTTENDSVDSVVTVPPQETTVASDKADVGDSDSLKVEPSESIKVNDSDWTMVEASYSEEVKDSDSVKVEASDSVEETDSDKAKADEAESETKAAVAVPTAEVTPGADDAKTVEALKAAEEEAESLAVSAGAHAKQMAKTEALSPVEAIGAVEATKVTEAEDDSQGEALSVEETKKPAEVEASNIVPVTEAVEVAMPSEEKDSAEEEKSADKEETAVPVSTAAKVSNIQSLKPKRKPSPPKAPVVMPAQPLPNAPAPIRAPQPIRAQQQPIVNDENMNGGGPQC